MRLSDLGPGAEAEQAQGQKKLGCRPHLAEALATRQQPGLRGGSQAPELVDATTETDEEGDAGRTWQGLGAPGLSPMFSGLAT